MVVYSGFGKTTTGADSLHLDDLQVDGQLLLTPEVTTSGGGLTVRRLTTADRDTVFTDPILTQGTVIYNLDTDRLEVFTEGLGWTPYARLSDAGGGGGGGVQTVVGNDPINDVRVGDNVTLDLQITAPMTVVGGELSVSTSSPLDISGGNLVLNLDPPLTLTGGGALTVVTDNVTLGIGGGGALTGLYVGTGGIDVTGGTVSAPGLQPLHINLTDLSSGTPHLDAPLTINNSLPNALDIVGTSGGVVGLRIRNTSLAAGIQLINGAGNTLSLTQQSASFSSPNATILTSTSGDIRILTDASVHGLTIKSPSGILEADVAYHITNVNFAAPTVNPNPRSLGTKIVLFPGFQSAGLGDYALGVEGGRMWFQVVSSTDGYKWYGGSSHFATLTDRRLAFDPVTGPYGRIEASPNDAIYLRSSRSAAPVDEVNYYSAGSHQFWTNGALAAQTLKFTIPATGPIAFPSGIQTASLTNAVPITTPGLDLSDRLFVNNSSVAPPNVAPNPRSIGTKLILWPNGYGSLDTGDFAIGIEGGAMWFQVLAATDGYRWYGGPNHYVSLTNRRIAFDQSGSPYGRIEADADHAIYLRSHRTAGNVAEVNYYSSGTHQFWTNGPLAGQTRKWTVPATGPLIGVGGLDLDDRVLITNTAVAVPDVNPNPRSAGTRLILYPNGYGAPGIGDFAIGMETGAMWFQVASITDSYRWYVGATQVLELNDNALFGSVDIVVPRIDVTDLIYRGLNFEDWPRRHGLFTQESFAVIGELNPGRTSGSIAITTGKLQIFCYMSAFVMFFPNSHDLELTISGTTVARRSIYFQTVGVHKDFSLSYRTTIAPGNYTFGMEMDGPTANNLDFLTLYVIEFL